MLRALLIAVLTGAAWAGCDPPLQLARKQAPKYAQVVDAVGMTPAMVPALTDDKSHYSVFVPTDQAWESFAAEVYRGTFNAMLLDTGFYERLRRVLLYNMAQALPSGQAFDETTHLSCGQCQGGVPCTFYLDTLLRPFAVESTTVPDPADITNPVKTSVFLRNPRTDKNTTEVVGATVEVRNSMQACGSVVLFAKAVLAPGDGLPSYPTPQPNCTMPL